MLINAWKIAFEGVSKENVHGTTIFLPPERLEGEGEGRASVKSDLWSLGCVVCFMGRVSACEVF